MGMGMLGVQSTWMYPLPPSPEVNLSGDGCWRCTIYLDGPHEVNLPGDGGAGGVLAALGHGVVRRPGSISLADHTYLFGQSFSRFEYHIKYKTTELAL